MDIEPHILRAIQEVLNLNLPALEVGQIKGSLKTVLAQVQVQEMSPSGVEVTILPNGPEA